MRSPWRFQFRLRTLLVAMLLLGVSPWIAIRLRERRRWNEFTTARLQRDQSLVAWRAAYDTLVQEGSPSAITGEVKAQTRYYAARKRVDQALANLQSLYGSPEQLILADQRRRAANTQNK